jgi:hypothetical protein
VLLLSPYYLMTSMRLFIHALLAVFSLLIFETSCRQGQATKTVVEKTDTLPKSNFDMSFFRKEGDAYIAPWPQLLSVKLVDTFSQKLNMDVALPMWNDTLKALDGQKVIVEGFYIPTQETGNEDIVIVSAYPFAQCFFCGKAGVESIVDVLGAKDLPKIKLDTKVRFKGKFTLNTDNFEYLIYVLEDAEYLGPVKK